MLLSIRMVWNEQCPLWRWSSCTCSSSRSGYWNMRKWIARQRRLCKWPMLLSVWMVWHFIRTLLQYTNDSDRNTPFTDWWFGYG